MARILKFLSLLLVSLVVLLVVGVFVLTRIIDPNDFKDDIAKLAKEHANVDLVIDGDISWAFWPSLALDVGRTEARIVDDKELFAGIDKLQMGVAVRPLFSRRVELDAIKLDGMELNLVQSKQGGNWEALIPEETEQTEQAPSTDEPGKLSAPVSIPSVIITNSKLRYRDLTDGTDIVIDNMALEATDVSLTEAFPVALSLRYQDQNDMRVRLNANTRLRANLEANQFSLAPFTMQTDIAGMTAEPLNINLNADILADLNADKLTVSNLQARTLGIDTQGNITVNNMTENFTLAGHIKTAPFNANSVLKALGEEPIETANSKALSKVSIAATLGGPANSVLLKPLTINLDDSTITGSAGITNLDTMAMAFDLNMDKIKLDSYLPPAAQSPAGPKGEATALSEEPLLPLELLRDFNVKGQLNIGQLDYDTFSINNSANSLNLAKGKLNMVNRGSLFDGSYSANTDLNASTNTPTIRSHISTDSLQIQRLIIMALDRDLLTGLVNLDATFTTKGNSEKELFENLNGKLDFGLLDAVTHGLDLSSSLFDGLNNMLTRVPGLAEQLNLPNLEALASRLSGDTKILDLMANTRLQDGVAHVDRLNAELDRGGALSGKGWLNLLNDEFKFDLKINLGSAIDSEHLTRREWPLHCAGKLTGNPATWCLPDQNFFQAEGKRLLQQLVQEKLGIDESRIADERAKLEARAEEEKAKFEARREEERAKLQDRVDKERDELRDKVKDKLKGLF